MAMVETPVPQWLKILVKSKVCTPYGEECSNHANKVDMNLCCLECCIPVCYICWAMHTIHPSLQIRRYVYKAVVNVQDLNAHFDCSSIQSYTNNGSQVVFLKRDPQAWPTRQGGSVCITCLRCLRDSFMFCSLNCKVEHLLQIEATKGQMNNPTTSSFRKRKRKSSAPLPLLDSLRIASIISFIYHVWTSRNTLIYNSQFTRAVECAANIISSIKNHFAANWKDRSTHSLQIAGMLQIRFD